MPAPPDDPRPRRTPAARARRRPTGAFLRSLAASTGLHGLVVAGLFAIVPVRWVMGQGGGRVQRVALLDLSQARPPRLPAPEREPTEVEVPAETLADPHLVDVPWTRFVDRLAPPDRTFEDPLGEEPLTSEDWSWSVPAPAVPAEEAPSADAPAPSEPLVADAEDPGSHALAVAEAVAQPEPSYPRPSIRRGEEGVVLCLLHIGADGGVARVEVLSSSGFALLDESAVETLLTWRFRPAREGALAVPSTVRHEVVFRLED